MKRWIGILAFIFLGVQLHAQVLPPDILCVTNDTIFYSPVTNACGSFLSYEVFRSSNPNGPFSSIAQLTDANADFYVDENSANQIFYYYLQPNFACQGTPFMNSDTISNRPPEVGILHTVSVVNNEIVLTWDLSPSAETVLYSVFLITDTGLELLGSTPDNTFTDLTNDPNTGSFEYLITANDACNIQSIFGDPLSSIFLSNQVDPCEAQVIFSWNRQPNAEIQELWLVDVSGQTVMLETISGQEETFTNAIPNTPIQGFFIRSIVSEQAGQFADSNLSVPSSQVTGFVDQIFFTRMETRDNNTLALEWCWNENAAVVNYDILQMGPGGANTQTQTVLGNLPAVVNETVNISNAEEGAYTIQVSSLDACDRIFDSNQISTIVISANPIAESTLELIWSDYNYIDASLTKYKLHQVKDGEDKIIFEGLGNSFTVEDFVDGVETCFYLEACAEGTLLDGSSKSTLVISNTACSNGFPIVRLPNAFNPYGFNTIFKPLFANTSVITSYAVSYTHLTLPTKA